VTTPARFFDPAPQPPQAAHSVQRVVEYVRMSTEHQRYSIDNQAAVIRRYAEDHNMEVIRTYDDAAKSGLTIHRRKGLQQLLRDVESGEPDFSAILVYDVSRWGRFLDVDESAYYEYRCRKVRINVHYCAESFANDGSISSDLLKALKRAMAREYSRELSAKVFAGKCRLVELGFRQGGHAGYGLRRLLVDAERRPKAYLKWGEAKSILTDRVILVPGPPEEIAVVREVFRLFAYERMTPDAIAAQLNELGIPNEQGRPWSRFIIDDMVTNPKYIGTNVTHRTSFKLRTKLVKNPPELWVKRENAFEAIIDADTFAQAAVVRATRTKRYTDEELLACLRDLLKQHGELTVSLIDKTPGMPSSKAYIQRFGSVRKAYKCIGYERPGNFSNRESTAQLFRYKVACIDRLVAELRAAGATVTFGSQHTLLVINNEFTVLFAFSRCRDQDGHGDHWAMNLDSNLKPDLTVVMRMARGNEEPLDYFLIPRMAMLPKLRFEIRAEIGFMLNTYRFPNLDILKALCRRTEIKELV
jgi:DNA invertase Pin-like site-specific DNA recombinase